MSALPDRRPGNHNRAMFWRIVRRLLFAHRARLFLIFLALGAGAAVTGALLNLQADAKRRLTSEFRRFGPNVLVLPVAGADENSATLPESIVRSIPLENANSKVEAASSLYTVVRISSAQSKGPVTAVLVGETPFAFVRALHGSGAGAPPNDVSPSSRAGHECVAGERLLRKLQAQEEAELRLSAGEYSQSCWVAGVQQRGGPEDDRIAMGLRAAQNLAGLPGLISAVELTVPGTPKQIEQYAANLQRILPEAEVRPLRQFTEAQGEIYSRIAGLLDFTVALVLILTSLCVMAAMANVAAERRNDVGLMKAIGGAKRRVLRLFLAEATLLGAAGGVIGAAAGIALSMYLGKAVFGLAARPRLIVYPVSVALTMMVAILSAFPLRRLANVRPASVFRGES